MSFVVKRILLVIGMVIFFVAAFIGLLQMKRPPAVDPIVDVDPLVDVLELEAGSFKFDVTSQGTVRPLTQTILSAEVSGQIVSVSPKFIAGRVFAAGEVLMRIDQTNYLGALEQATATLKQRQIEFDGARTLRTQGYRAETEFASAEAALATARANLTRAERDLDRTSIRLPYDGMARSRTTDIGQFVNPGQQLGIVFATDYAEVRLPLTDQDLALIELPDASEITESGESASGPLVTLTATQRGRESNWTARIVRGEGVVDERARVTYAVARIRDPYQLQPEDAGIKPLPMGTFVQARIDGGVVDNVVRVPRATVRRNNQMLFVGDDNLLEIESVVVLHSDARHSYIDADGTAGRRIVLTAIESPLNGIRVRPNGDSPGAAATPQQESGAGE